MADNLPLSVPWSGISDFFSCPVCMNNMSDTHVTKCGHRYCAGCIRECIDRHHKCPCCNNALTQHDIIKDHQFDELLRVCVIEKEKAEKKYFDTLINKVVTSEGNGPMDKLLSPVESVLKEHLKKTFSSYEKYYKEVKDEFSEKLACLETEFKANEKKIHEQSVKPEEVNMKLERLANVHKSQIEILEKDLEKIGQLLAESFDRYLDKRIPDLSALPVTVTISILNKGIQFSDVTIKPHYNIEDIKDIFRHEMQAKGDKIIEFGDDTKFLYFRPLARRSLCEMHNLAEAVVDKKTSHKDIVVLPADCVPVLEYHMQPGSEISVIGRVVCESDLPKRCFAITYQPEHHAAVDYFTCKDCKINWICRPCMEVCHKDHNVTPYIMNHRPTWPCCYCMKKKKCKIQQDV